MVQKNDISKNLQSTSQVRNNINITNRSSKRSIDLTNNSKKDFNDAKNKTITKNEGIFSTDNSYSDALPSLTGSFVSSTKNSRAKIQRTNSSFIV